MIPALLHSLYRAIVDGFAYTIATLFIGSLWVPPEWLP